MKNLFILTNQAGHIPQKILESDSVSATKIRSYFNNRNFKVFIYTYDQFISELSNIAGLIKGSYFFYASSQHKEYYSAFEDILLFIGEKGGILIPEYIHFRAHENKFIQELVKADLKIKCPHSWLITSLEEGLEKIKDINFPVVGKLSSGFGSSSVSLIRTEKEGKIYLEKNLSSVVKKRKNIIKYRKQIEYTKGKHPLKVGKLILQEYIDGIENDWKILVFGNRLFFLKRYFRKNDFRASGSGNFDNSQHPDNDILEFALSIRKKLKTPWVSLDILKKGNDIYLIEYQCVHFGLYTVMKSTEHFEYINGKFELVKGTPDEDMLFAEELYNYINDLEK